MLNSNKMPEHCENFDREILTRKLLCRLHNSFKNIHFKIEISIILQINL